MKKIIPLLCLLSGLAIGAVTLADFPEKEISNGSVKALIYLPDTAEGYYRGRRFDWAGVVAGLEYKGHSYYGQWFDNYDPNLHDAIMGPVEDFSPLGFDEAKAGDPFIKIGIGVLAKQDESRYNFSKTYTLLDHGTWNVESAPDNVQFMHRLDNKGYAYEYKKTLQLTKGKPELVLTHTLKNTGKQTIETNVYDHNFLMIDKQPVGPDYVIKFPFDPVVKEAGVNADLVKIQGAELLITRTLAQKESVFLAELTGYSSSAKDYDLRVENRKTGAGVRITSDRPVSKLVFWSSPRTICPEPYIHVKVEPGREFSWKISYEYYTL